MRRPLAGVRSSHVPGAGRLGRAGEACRDRAISSAAAVASEGSEGQAGRMLDPAEWQLIDFSGLSHPRLVLLVDAEEEFDWREPFSRHNSRVSNIRAQHRAHRIFERYG